MSRTLADYATILGITYENGDYVMGHSDTTYTLFVSPDGFQHDADDLDRPCKTFFYNRTVDGSDPADDRTFPSLRDALDEIMGA